MPNGSLLLDRVFARGEAPDVLAFSSAGASPRGVAPDVPAFLDVLDVAVPGAAGASA